MSMTKEQMIDDMQKESELYAESGNRLKNGALDDHYIEAYEKNPLSKKIDLLRTAIKSAGISMQATRQRAYEIHNRLSETLEKRLMRAVKDARRLGLNVVMELAQKSESDSVRATCGLALTKDIMPDVTISKQESIEDIDKELEQIEEDIHQAMH